MEALELRDNAKNQLLQIKDIESGFEYLNKVKAIETWAKAEKKDAELQNIIAEQKIRTQRILGGLIKDGQEKGEIAKQSGQGANRYSTNVRADDICKKTLSEIGITRNESSTFQKIAELPEELFEKEIALAKDESKKRVELTTSRVLQAAKEFERAKNIQEQKEVIKSENIKSVSGLYDVISVDPPWQYGREYDAVSSRVASPYPEMSIEQIKAIELPFKDDAILFLWTTHKFLPDSFEILKHWGFEYKATIVWNKEKMGMGAWFRMQCEFCLFAIKGTPFFNNTTERDIITEQRREHSRKPDSFFQMVNKVCTGKKLEYFAREKRNGWDVFGNDTAKF
jgi:N6-adenosine-specific RNA methylase IME4